MVGTPDPSLAATVSFHTICAHPRPGHREQRPRPRDLARGYKSPPIVASANDVAHVRIAPVRALRGAEVLVEMLVDLDVGVVFGLPGGAISPVHDALIDSGLRVVTTRHESGAMFAAAAYARATGKLGVVAVTSGPGVLNAMTGLATAWCDGVPLLLLVGEVPRAAHGRSRRSAATVVSP